MPKGVVNCVNCDINGGGGPITSDCVKAYVEEYLGTNKPPDGYTTYRLFVDLVGNQQNLFSIAGTVSSPMEFPPAHQEAAPFGANIGGTYPASWPINLYGASSEYDSWLTIGITDGNAANQGAPFPLMSDDLGFAQWTTTSGLSTTDGAVSYINHDEGPSGSAIVIAQLTVSTGTSWTARCNLQGKTLNGAVWTCEGVEWASP